VQASVQAQFEASQAEEGALVGVQDEQRAVHEDLSAKAPLIRRLRDRLDQLMRMREEYREWSAEQLEEAQRTAEQTEDAVHAVSVGTTGPKIRDAAESDKLRLMLQSIQTQGAVLRSQLEEQIQREEERFAEHRRGVLKQLEQHVKEAEELEQEIDSMLEEEPNAKQVWRKAALRGGC